MQDRSQVQFEMGIGLQPSQWHVVCMTDDGCLGCLCESCIHISHAHIHMLPQVTPAVLQQGGDHHQSKNVIYLWRILPVNLVNFRLDFTFVTKVLSLSVRF